MAGYGSALLGTKVCSTGYGVIIIRLLKIKKVCQNQFVVGYVAECEKKLRQEPVCYLYKNIRKVRYLLSGGVSGQPTAVAGVAD